MPVAGFGKNGIVDLKQDDDQDDRSRHRRDRPARDADRRQERRHRRRRAPDRRRARRARRNVKGYVRGFDVRTGKRLWIFHTIPQPGEFGNDTWENDSWSYTGNAGVWAQITRRRRARPGRICRSSCRPATTTAAIVPATTCSARASSRVDLKTGKRKWHYQLVHHGIWDMDIPCAPILVDITVNGRTDQGGRAADQAGVALRVRSRDRPAGLADRRAAGARKATCRASGTRRRSRFRPSRRPSIARACRSTI